ncbi:hypothetical protein ETB97_005000 [Aspergillus alliaceus]|uniref:Uncharacterized protein n=1 Tax=Petromyces alliaceus TaxID=209559 RepID=A0A5N7CPM9_PETAA|nr:uncharacterized protein BDW43DRAFT_308097 [Aspergillus alliaceus]KAB8236414.1 hypothetical protein BDW43DRAFT_308097 [Aspergillus alliaceus]KAE8396141.1 hypothetical protein BDV23DRAFT_178198 [Aspergillus alliaceus]KAF5857969.1 hypothetical protein ETB97_005000 [Aspergillus burnettii]
MFKSPGSLYAALAATGAAGYYLFRSKGDPNAARRQIKDDADRAMKSINETEQRGEKTDAYIQQAIRDAQATAKASDEYLQQAIKDLRAKAAATDQQLSDTAKESVNKLEKYLEGLRNDINSSVEEFDKSMELKAAEAKRALSEWVGEGVNNDGKKSDKKK